MRKRKIIIFFVFLISTNILLLFILDVRANVSYDELFFKAEINIEILNNNILKENVIIETIQSLKSKTFIFIVPFNIDLTSIYSSETCIISSTSKGNFTVFFIYLKPESSSCSFSFNKLNPIPELLGGIRKEVISFDYTNSPDIIKSLIKEHNAIYKDKIDKIAVDISDAINKESISIRPGRTATISEIEGNNFLLEIQYLSSSFKNSIIWECFGIIMITLLTLVGVFLGVDFEKTSESKSRKVALGIIAIVFLSFSIIIGILWVTSSTFPLNIFLRLLSFLIPATMGLAILSYLVFKSKTNKPEE